MVESVTARTPEPVAAKQIQILTPTHTAHCNMCHLAKCVISVIQLIVRGLIFLILRPAKDQIIFYYVLICKTCELKDGVLSFCHDYNVKRGIVSVSVIRN